MPLFTMRNPFRKTGKRELNLPKNLSKAQGKEILQIIRKARSDDGIPRSAQDSIPFQRMFPDGICRVTDYYYTLTIQYQGINYQLAQQEDKTAIFEEWCAFLNSFDSSIHFELSFMNMATDAESFEKKAHFYYCREALMGQVKTPGNRISGGFSARYSVLCGQQSFSKCQISLLYWSIVLSEEK